jgi:hypothetical protein
VDLRPRPGTFTINEDVWEPQDDGSQRRVYRRGQRISLDQAVAAGLTFHPDRPETETLTAEKDEPKPTRERKPKTAAGKARKHGTVQDKARKRAQDKGDKRGS